VHQKFTKDQTAVSNSVPGGSDSSADTLVESCLTAVAFSGADRNIGWIRFDKDPTDKLLVRHVIIFSTDIISTRMLENEYGRHEAKGDGSDTCLNSLPPNDATIQKSLENNNISLIGLITDGLFEDENGRGYHAPTYYSNIFGSMNVRYTSYILDLSNVDKIVSNLVEGITNAADCRT